MIRTDKLIVSVCPVGSWVTKEVNPNVPLQPEEIAAEVRRCENAGASIVHIHARDREGNATSDAAVFAERLRPEAGLESDDVVAAEVGEAILPREDGAGELASALRAEIDALPGDGPRSLALHAGTATAPWDATAPDQLLELAALRAADAPGR